MSDQIAPEDLRCHEHKPVGKSTDPEASMEKLENRQTN
jgi:hypothetical protein